MTERQGGGEVDAAWYRRWFGPEYLELYPHRDRAEAARGVKLFLNAAAPPPDGRVLDLGCGAGRHLSALRAGGRTAVGLDLSSSLLRRARSTLGAELPLVRGDMRRLPFGAETFAGAASFFTSFGYFRDPADDVLVLRELRRVLRGDASFLLDFLNARRVREGLVPRETVERGGNTVRIRRWIEESAVVKRIEIAGGGEGGEDGEPRVFHERVRLYEPAELEGLLEREGLEARERFGDYEGAAFEETSPRLILVGGLR